MPYFKKFIWLMILAGTYLLAIYFVMYEYLKENHLLLDYRFFQDILPIWNKALSIGFETSVLEPLWEGFLGFFSFQWKNNHQVMIYVTFCGISGVTFLFLLLKVTTYRGLAGIVDEIKKTKANPRYYDDYRKQSRFSPLSGRTSDLSEDIFIVVFPLRLLFMAVFYALMPIVVPFFGLLHIIGFLKGMANAGLSEDFE